MHLIFKEQVDIYRIEQYARKFIYKTVNTNYDKILSYDEKNIFNFINNQIISIHGYK